MDRLGRVTTITQGSRVTTKSYSDAGQLVTESNSGGPVSGIILTNSFDSLLRRSRLTLNSQLIGQSGSDLSTTDYACDAASRLSSASDGTNTATYSSTATLFKKNIGNSD